MFDFTLVALPGAFASGITASLDLLANAAELAHEAGCAKPTWRVCSTRRTVALSNGISIAAEPLRPDGEDSSIWLVAGLNLGSPDLIERRFVDSDIHTAITAIRAHARTGATVAASCSAVFLLQAAGLLAGRCVTTTWWLGGYLQSIAPDARVDVDRMVVDDDTIITAGAAFSHLDLTLHLLHTRFSPVLAEAVSRRMIVDGRKSQAQFIVPAALARGNDLVGKVIARFEAGLPDPPNVSELAAEFGMSTRTLSRKVKAATGRNVNALLQTARLNRARMLLETSNISIEKVASQVGYADTTALRRMMLKITKASPSSFRAPRPSQSQARRLVLSQ